MAAYESFAEVYDLFMDNVPYDAWKDNLLGILARYKITEGLVAELGCGTGKMTRRLAESGYDMIGIDNSYEMLGILQRASFICVRICVLLSCMARSRQWSVYVIP